MADVIQREQENALARQHALDNAADPLNEEEHALRVAQMMSTQQRAECAPPPHAPPFLSPHDSCVHALRRVSPLPSFQPTFPSHPRLFPSSSRPGLSFPARSNMVFDQDMEIGAQLTDIDGEIAAREAAMAISNQARKRRRGRSEAMRATA